MCRIARSGPSASAMVLPAGRRADVDRGRLGSLPHLDRQRGVRRTAEAEHVLSAVVDEDRHLISARDDVPDVRLVWLVSAQLDLRSIGPQQIGIGCVLLREAEDLAVGQRIRRREEDHHRFGRAHGDHRRHRHRDLELRISRLAGCEQEDHWKVIPRHPPPPWSHSLPLPPPPATTTATITIVATTTAAPAPMPTHNHVLVPSSAGGAVSATNPGSGGGGGGATSIGGVGGGSSGAPVGGGGGSY